RPLVDEQLVRAAAREGRVEAPRDDRAARAVLAERLPGGPDPAEAVGRQGGAELHALRVDVDPRFGSDRPSRGREALEVDAVGPRLLAAAVPRLDEPAVRRGRDRRAALVAPAERVRACFRARETRPAE